MQTSTPASAAHAQGIDTRSFTHTIDGQPETSEAWFEVINPATGSPFAQCPKASAEQLDRAVAAARRAFADWSRRSLAERRDLIHRFAKRLRESSDEIAPALTREQGKPLSDARGEVMIAAHHLEALSSLELPDEELLRDDGQNHIVQRYRPLGVVGGIAPWNFPVALGMHKVAQALYTGNTLVLKPSPYTPLSTLLVGAITREVFPPGVVNILAGGDDLGRWMTEHRDIDKISFTGSVPTGKRVLASVGATLKRVTLELGGNDPAIVLEDADLSAAATGVFRSSFYNCGQICMAIKRVYIADRLYDSLCESLAEMARAYRVGDGFEPGVQMGPIQNKMQYEKVVSILEDTGNQPGVRIHAGGHALNRPGYFVAPTVVSGIGDDARLVREEQFGPVLPLLRFTEVEDAIRRANQTLFGLSASVWTKDIQKGAEIGARLEAGSVWVNRHGVNESDLPFGGAKESGFGREHGVMGLRAYMESQVLSRPSLGSLR